MNHVEFMQFTDKKNPGDSSTYLEGREVLLHVAPAEEPHLVVRFVIVELHGVRVCADRLQRDGWKRVTKLNNLKDKKGPYGIKKEYIYIITVNSAFEEAPL